MVCLAVLCLVVGFQSDIDVLLWSGSDGSVWLCQSVCL